MVAAADWTPRRDAHRARIQTLIGDYLGARSRAQMNPVIDFLFTYYRHRPGQLLRWHPGFGIVLADADEYAGYRGYTRTAHGVTADLAFLELRRCTIADTVDLLGATAGRPAQLSCFGLHEWAMVYRDGDIRHARIPLRLGRDGTDAVVDALDLRCTHYDAYRFFSRAASPRNRDPLTRSTQARHEQPGCLHAAMDLYRFCYRLEPLVSSGLTADCFELAYAARELDMRASPYDLSALGYLPIRIETPAGRAEYARLQAVIAERSAGLRAELVRSCRALLDHTRHTGRPR